MTDEGMHHFAAMAATRRKRKRYRNKFAENLSDQIEGLIDAVLSGEDIEEVLDNTINEIKEGYGGGPYHMGNPVKMNSPWVGSDITGKPVSIQKGEVVTIIHPALGEKGYERMVLLPDGATKAIVPLRVLGEAMVGMAMPNVLKGPMGHLQPATTGTKTTMGGKLQGDVDKPEDSPLAKGRGNNSPMAMPSQVQGQPEPRGDMMARQPGSMVPTAKSGIAVEDIAAKFTEMLYEADSLEAYKRINELARAVFDIDDEILYSIIAEALFGDEEVHLSDLEWLVEQDDVEMDDDEMETYNSLSPAERKKYRRKLALRKKYRKMYGESEELTEGKLM